MFSLLKEMANLVYSQEELNEFVKPKRRDDGDDDDNDDNHFGLTDKENIKKVKEHLKQFGYSYTSNKNMGITYFYFDSNSKMQSAYKQVLKIIDKSKESAD